MSVKTTEIATSKIIRMQECIEKNDRQGFLNILSNGYTLNNCTLGDSFLQAKVIEVLKQALEKFIGEKQ